MAEVTYVCKAGSSNKFWSYDIDGLSVTMKWGRIGLAGQSKTKSFRSEGQLDNFLNKKIAEKVKKGYAETTKQELRQEKETANEIGHKNKIMQMLWVQKRKDGSLKKLSKYNPRKHVLVEIMDSWSKDKTYLLLSKEESLQIYSPTSLNSDVITYRRDGIPASRFVNGVRNVLRRLAKKVADVAIKFAAVGSRSLDLGDGGDDWTEEDVQGIMLEVADDSASAQVVTQFAAMGARTLEL